MAARGPRRRWPRASRRLVSKDGLQDAIIQAREAEILLRFAVRLAMLACTALPEQRYAAFQALLLEQAHTLTAVRALARAERWAAEALTLRQPAASAYSAGSRPTVRRCRLRPSRRRHRLRLIPVPKPGG